MNDGPARPAGGEPDPEDKFGDVYLVIIDNYGDLYEKDFGDRVIARSPLPAKGCRTASTS